MQMHALQERFQTLLDFLLPPSCVVCKNSAAWLCESCFSKIRFISPPVCERCGTPTSASSSSFCRQCQNNPLRDIDGIRAASYFDNNPIRPVIHCLKYGNHKAVTADLGRILADAYHRYNLTAEVIVPVPLHASRFKLQFCNG